MRKTIIFFLVTSLLLILANPTFSGGKWYNFYKDGLKLMEKGKWSLAIEKFNQALKVKNRDMKKIKTYGMHFIPYFPHREKGICFYNLGQMDRARQELTISIKQQYSARAQEYLSKIKGGPPPPTFVQTKTTPPKDDEPTNAVTSETPPEPSSDQLKLVGERMGIAVLPFQTKGLGSEIGEINIVEQMMTTFYNLKRFKLFERSQLEKILEEQKLAMSGVIDASTAAEIGKGIGVDAIVLGSVTRAGSNIAIDVRLIDTETAEIITAQDEMSYKTSIAELRNMINRLANKIINDLPLVEGYVIGVNGDELTLDIGANKNIKKGMKCIVYREGKEIIHPITKKVLGIETEELGTIKLTNVYPNYSIGKVIKMKSGIFQIGDKIITK